MKSRVYTKLTNSLMCLSGAAVLGATMFIQPAYADDDECQTGPDATPCPTREFEIRDNQPYLGGEKVKLWGFRWANALMNPAVTERAIRNMDNLIAHGFNTIGVYIQGSNGGYPDKNAGRNGFDSDGTLKPKFAKRLEWIIREADARGMVVMVGIFSPRKDQYLDNDDAIKNAVKQTASFLKNRKLRNVFVDIMHEYNHQDGRIDHEIFLDINGDGAKKKAKLAFWFHEIAPDIEVGVCPAQNTGTAYPFKGMDVFMVQKEMDFPEDHFVVNVEMQKQDSYDKGDKEGVFDLNGFDAMEKFFYKYKEANNTALLFHSAFSQGITGESGSGPHFEMGGMGESKEDRGVRFWYELVRDEVGVWEYPDHQKDD